MGKSDRDHAFQLLQMARRDHQTITHMLDRDPFSEEVFGFHAQQSIEKALKAWITAKGLTYPKSQDVSALTSGEDVTKFPKLEDYTIYAVQYRYEAYDESEEQLDPPTSDPDDQSAPRSCAACLGEQTPVGHGKRKCIAGVNQSHSTQYTFGYCVL